MLDNENNFIQYCLKDNNLTDAHLLGIFTEKPFIIAAHQDASKKIITEQKQIKLKFSNG